MIKTLFRLVILSFFTLALGVFFCPQSHLNFVGKIDFFKNL